MLCFSVTSYSATTSVVHTYLSAIPAVVLGALLAYAYTKRLEKKKITLSLISDFSSDLRKINDLCEKYWLGDHSDVSRQPELAAVGYKLRAALMATAEYRELMRSLMGPRFEDFDKLDTLLTMAATGGNFQTSSMKSSPETFQEISSLVLKTELILRTLRSSF